MKCKDGIIKFYLFYILGYLCWFKMQYLFIYIFFLNMYFTYIFYIKNVYIYIYIYIYTHTVQKFGVSKVL